MFGKTLTAYLVNVNKSTLCSKEEAFDCYWTVVHSRLAWSLTLVLNSSLFYSYKCANVLLFICRLNCVCVLHVFHFYCLFICHEQVLPEVADLVGVEPAYTTPPQPAADITVSATRPYCSQNRPKMRLRPGLSKRLTSRVAYSAPQDRLAGFKGA